MRFRPPSRRRIAVLALGALAAAAVLWSAAWLAIACGLARGIEGWVRDRRAEGWTATHGALALAGFPVRWRARIDRPHLARTGGAAGGFSWSGPWIELGWAPWAARSVTLRTADTHALGLEGEEGGRYRLEADAIAGRLGLGRGGTVERIDVAGDAISLAPPDGGALGGPFRVNRAILHADLRPAAPASPGTPPPALTLDADILGLTLPATVRPALGRTVGRIAGRATVMGALTAGRPAQALTAWRDAGGVVEIARLALGWGPLTARGEGTLALDTGLQPIGALTARIQGYAETIDRLRAAGALNGNQALLGKLALGALARPSKDGGRPEVAVPVAVQDRTLTVGPVALVRLPRIAWR